MQHTLEAHAMCGTAHSPVMGAPLGMRGGVANTEALRERAVSALLRRSALSLRTPGWCRAASCSLGCRSNSHCSRQFSCSEPLLLELTAATTGSLSLMTSRCVSPGSRVASASAKAMTPRRRLRLRLLHLLSQRCKTR